MQDTKKDVFSYGTSIASCYPTPHGIWVLAAATYCEKSCDGSLLKVGDGPTALRAQNVPASTIDGYDAANDVVYMHGGYGDAGCIWSQLTEYHGANNQVVKGEYYSYCAEESGAEAQQKAMEAYFDRFPSANGSDIAVAHGALSVATSTVGPFIPVRYVR